ncbi:MAG: hydantoinase B/oxoprolinase family protein [Solirubrobacterales bacterium]
MTISAAERATSEDPRELLREENYGMAFDGNVFSYIPQQGWREQISPRVKLHTETAGEVDPITYQVIRYGLWNINEEHGIAIQKVSGSPVAVYGSDLNPTLLLEDGEYVYAGPYVQLMAGSADLYASYVLERYGDNPGINEGDVFFGDDPWVAGYHQSDHYALEPVFWEGRIFCWVVSTLHHPDSGGTLPGSFCVDAEHVFKEPLPMPPFKIVEEGVLRSDLEDLFARRSRVPGLVRLDLRSQLAGLHVAKERTLALLRQYGPAVVKYVMRRIVDDSEESFVRKLDQIPDGEWRVRTFVESALPDDRGTYRIDLQLEKRGDWLIFGNDGTEDAYGSHNCTWAGWRAYILPALASTLASDQLYAIGGILRHTVFKPNPGSTVNALHPSAVGSAIVVVTVAAQAAQGVSRMLMASPLKRDLLTPSALSGALWPSMGGTDNEGNVFATITPDMMIGGLGAFSFRDGTSTAGHFWNPKSSGPNVEANEHSYPMLYLYRRENKAAGVGRYVGGDCVEIGWIGHGAEEITVSSVGSGIAVPTGLGVAGALPAATGHFKVLNDSNVHKMMTEEGRLPGSLADVEGDVHFSHPKQFGIKIGPNEVFEWSIMAGAGYGDPLERDPEMVAADFASGRYDADAAAELFAVALDEAGSVNLEGTEALRASRHQDRLGKASPPKSIHEAATVESGAERRPLLEAIDIVESDAGPLYVCNRCEHQLGGVDQPYKHWCSEWEGEVAEIGPAFRDPADSVDDHVVWREFYCPGCGVMFENELAREGEELLADARLVALRSGSSE